MVGTWRCPASERRKVNGVGKTSAVPSWIRRGRVLQAGRRTGVKVDEGGVEFTGLGQRARPGPVVREGQGS